MEKVIDMLVVVFSILFGLVVFNVLLKKNPFVSLIVSMLICLVAFNLIQF